MTSDQLLTRDEVLGGLPARRAHNLLFLIESRTAHLVQRGRQRMQRFQSEETSQEQELAFIEAFALGREPPLRPSIQDMERHAPDWADLVPPNPSVRAAVARQLGDKYRFTAGDTPQLRAALGLESEQVQQAFERLYKEPLTAIYAGHVPLRTRLNWAMSGMSSRLESLPPFWTAFALTLTETVGAGILALPIALAGIGPIPGIVLIVIFGLVNTISIAWIAESATRTASIRYGGAYFGRMVTEYLGSAGGLLMTLALAIIAVSFLMAYAIGLSSTLASVTGISAAVWIAIHFAIVLYMITRESLNSTIASALAIGFVNLGVLAVLTLLGMLHIDGGNLGHAEVPWFNGQPLDGTVLALIFGVILCAYFGHTSVGNCASIVLQRDPSGRSLIWGVAVAQIVAITCYSLWILAINGSIDAGALSGYTGTALDPLADVAGPVVYGFGTIFVVLAMGMGAIHMALGLANIVRERLPRRAIPVVVLPRGTGRLVFTPRRSTAAERLRLVLSYRGMERGKPAYRLRVQDGDTAHVFDHRSPDRWVLGRELEMLSDAAKTQVSLVLETLHADAAAARVQITSSMAMSYEGTWTSPSVDLVGLLEEPDQSPNGTTELMRWMLRQGTVDVAQTAAWLEVSEQDAAAQLQTMVDEGQVREVEHNGPRAWRANVGRRRARSMPGRLQAEEAASRTVGDRSRALVGAGSSWFSEGLGRKLLENAPLLAIFFFTEWLVITDRASFSGVLSLSGVIAVPIFAGIFPAIMLLSSRRRGDLVPGIWYPFLGKQGIIWSIFVVFLLGILLHGLIIWETPGERLAAFAAAVAALGTSWMAIERGAFVPRTVMSVRENQRDGGQPMLEVVSNGGYKAVEVRMDASSGTTTERGSPIELPSLQDLRTVSMHMNGGTPSTFKVWVKRLTPEGLLETLPATARVRRDIAEEEVDLRVAGGIVEYPEAAASVDVEIRFEGATNVPDRNVDPKAALADL